jgi:hypothetical protein
MMRPYFREKNELMHCQRKRRKNRPKLELTLKVYLSDIEATFYALYNTLNQIRS